MGDASESGPGLVLRGRVVATDRPLVMAIVNATPDSFSDTSPAASDEARVAHALAALDEGADLVDVGGQSGITGVPEIAEEVEIARVLPVVAGILAARPGALVSVDTYRPAVTEAVLDAGAALVNDVSCLRHPEVARACAAAGAGLVVMHTKVPPKQRFQEPDAYGDVSAEVAAVLADRLAVAAGLGVDPAATVVDPGVDYAKTPAQTVALLRDLAPVRALGRPVLYALSRKDFVGALTATRPRDRGAGTLAAIGHVGPQPGAIFRVHDVRATVEYLTVARALAGQVEVAPGLVLADELRWQRGRPPTDGMAGEAGVVVPRSPVAAADRAVEAGGSR
ncbi:MAG TPA: dihydropteroate synthase [Acidimicrobiales bacterium]|nr:dihydropteroate synthase [Acidimicrobiales bacterium]